jgi:hypothetical protein
VDGADCPICASINRVERVERQLSVLKYEIGELWARCRIVYYPKNGGYPIEHSMAAGKDQRQTMEHVMAHDVLMVQRAPLPEALDETPGEREERLAKQEGEDAPY